MFFSKYYKQLFWLFFLLLFIPVSAFSKDNYLSVTDESHSISLIPYTKIIVDNEHRYQIADIAALSAEHFEPLSKSSNTIGFSEAVFWLHFRLKGAANAPGSMLLTLDAPTIDYISLFSSAGSFFKEQQAGDKIAYSQRQIKHRNAVFLLAVPKDQPADYYLRVESQGPIQLPLNLSSIEHFIAHQDKAQLLFGAYYVFMLILIITSFYAYRLLREQVFFRYSVYLTAFLLLQMSINGISFQYFWGQFPQIASQINSSLVGVVIVSALWFSSEFLKLKKHSRISYQSFQFLQLLTAVCTLLIWTDLFQLATKLVIWCGFILVPVFMVASIQVIKQGYKSAYYFSLAWSILMLGIFTAGLRYSGYIQANFYTTYSMQISSILEISILFFSLVERFNLMHNAKAVAEQQAVEATHKLNYKLEVLVAERTQALEESNRKLEALATQDSLTGLLNHSTSIKMVARALNGSLRHNYAIAVVMVDIDFFKLLNDNYGHQAGDDILCAIAQVLSSDLRSTDSCGRYGGEEFILLLTHLEMAEVKALCERLRMLISQIHSVKAPGAKVTASMGIAMCYPVHSHQYTVDTLIAAADQALYKAKEQGRNKVCFAPSLQLAEL